jgi:hypothetical protein
LFFFLFFFFVIVSIILSILNETRFSRPSRFSSMSSYCDPD